MTPEQIIDDWTQALRSGEYQQAAGNLRPTCGGFCCLGVLCDREVKRGVGEWNDDGSYCLNGCADSSYLPDALNLKLGFKREVCRTLASMNDESGCPFTEIADYIDSRKHEWLAQLSRAQTGPATSTASFNCVLTC